MRDPLTLSAEERVEAGKAARYFMNVWMPRWKAIADELTAAGVSGAELWQQAAVRLVDELGEDLVHAIRWCDDGRVRTRAGAVACLLRDIYDFKTKERVYIAMPEIPAEWKVGRAKGGR